MAVACSQDEASGEVTPTVTAVSPTATTIPATATSAPQPTNTATPAPSPTPIMPTLAVIDQEVAENGRLTVTEVTTTEPSLLVIFSWQGGELGEVVGLTAIDSMEDGEVVVTIDPLQASSQLAAQLYVASGDIDAFVATEADALTAPMPFAIEVEMALPTITVADQDLTLTNTLTIPTVALPMAGWLVIQSETDGAPSDILNFTYVEAGRQTDVAVTVNPLVASSQLYATLYRDNGRLRAFDPAEDEPLLVQGEAVREPFAVALPQDIYILDQPVIDGEVIIERIASTSEGWVAIYNDNDGEVGFIIGSEQIEAGVNEGLVIEVTAQSVSDQLYVRLHADNEPLGEFNPGADLLLPTADGRVPGPTPFNAAPTDYFIFNDQPITSSLLMPLAVVANESWVAIYDVDDEELGQLRGSAWLPAGINRDVMIDVSAPLPEGVYYAVLHQDLGESQLFEAEIDAFTLYNGRLLQILFQVTTEAQR